MRFGRGEQEPVRLSEPQVFGVDIDPASAELYATFAEGRSFDQIYDLWKDPEVTNPTIRQRAVAVLTAPYGYSLPYPHTEEGIGRLVGMTEVVEGKSSRSLRERISANPKLAAELAQGVLYWLDATEGHIEGARIDSRGDYQSAIQQLLPLVDEKTGDQLFARYLLNDTEPFFSLDSASGYTPLVKLLHDKAMPRKYKGVALAKWFDVANQEEQGVSQPREEHERAIRTMAEFVTTWTYGDAVDDTIHTTIIAFLENNIPADKTYVDAYAARQVAEHITSDDLRFDFAWRHLFVDAENTRGQYRINSEDDLKFVDWMRQQARERNLPQFEAKADALVAAYESERQERLAKQAAELALRNQMRA